MFLEDLGIAKHSEIEPRLFAECLGIKVTSRALPGFDGCLLRICNFGTIICNSEIKHETRKRFTVAHELGHWHLHQNHIQDFLQTEQSGSRYTNCPKEAEANAFAGSLLMPRKWFGRHVSGAEPVIATILEASLEFDVSVMAATKRFLDLTLVPSMAIFSDGHQVKWTWQSNHNLNIFLLPGTRISESCTAFNCTDSIEVATTIGAIENIGEDWFPGEFRRDKIMVKEQSFRLYQDLVLTLMSVAVT